MVVGSVPGHTPEVGWVPAVFLLGKQSDPRVGAADLTASSLIQRLVGAADAKCQEKKKRAEFKDREGKDSCLTRFRTARVDLAFRVLAHSLCLKPCYQQLVISSRLVMCS